MSTKILGTPHEFFAAPNVRNGKRFVVSTEHESLSDYLRRVIKEKNLRYRQISERSGGGVSPSTISDIISGRTKEIKSGTISALAKGIGVPEEEVFAVVRGRSIDKNGFEESEFALMYDDVSKLTPQQRRDFKIAWEMAKDALRRIKRESNKESDK
jgi:transcriptional regulator with XRE-family HTH domain